MSDTLNSGTLYLAGREISHSQKPYVEADIASAREVLTRLLSLTAGREVSSITPVIQEIEV